MPRVWSDKQNAIFDFAVSGEGNAVLIAVAGSGKTTTIEECYRRVLAARPESRVIFLTFAKASAIDLERRGVPAKTFHGFCYSPVMKRRGQRVVDEKKLWRVIDDNFRPETAALYADAVRRMVEVGKQMGIGTDLAPDAPELWRAILHHHDITMEEGATDARACELASLLLEASYRDDHVDWSDMLYFAIRDGIALPKFDMIFVDEAQDTNAIQREILRRIMAPGARIIAVGDPAQAIYGFRGADAESMNLIRKQFECRELPLTVSYRCPKAVVAYAHQWVSHIEPHAEAPEGEVVHKARDWNPAKFEATDLVVCRTNAPLISLAYRILSAGRGVTVLGRDIGKGLAALVRKMDARSGAELRDKLEAHWVAEYTRFMARDEESKAEAIKDKAQSLLAILDGLPEAKRSVEALLDVITELFRDRNGVTRLGTIHKVKGLEAPRVWWLNSDLCPAQWARQAWQQEQERNLCYVATTRAQQSLITIQEI